MDKAGRYFFENHNSCFYVPFSKRIEGTEGGGNDRQTERERKREGIRQDYKFRG